ncbi:MAG: hypothetical protein ACOX9C_12555 [Kiritimatiellia bacterium]|jgi:hypothetical protein
MKKRIMLLGMLGIAGLFAGLAVNGAEETAATGTTPVVAPSQYVALAKLLAESKGDIAKASEIAQKAVDSVVGKGKTYEEKRVLLSEIATTLFAAIKDWRDEGRIAVAKAIAGAIPALASDAVERVGFVEEAFASMTFASMDTIPLIAAFDVLPEALKADAQAAVHEPITILGGTHAWACRDLYNAVRDALGARPDEERPGDVYIVAVSTTTTTTTSTTTTTTSWPGTGLTRFVGPDAVPDVGVTTTRPPWKPVVPTTKPSPTPVGRR